MRSFIFVFVVLGTVLVFPAFSQPGPIAAPGSSEWEATGFNNGRRIVRDSNGYFHAFWHSRTPATSAPAGFGCDIYYSFTTAVAAEPPSMAAPPGNWSMPVNLTASLGFHDNRYPSVAIEYDDDNGAWTATNALHIVWQAMEVSGGRYDVYYTSIPVTSSQGIPPTPPGPLMVAVNLSQTPTDSLVPAIAINQYNPSVANQHLHVVWQEEDINDNGGLLAPPAEDNWFSDIAYIRSINSGAMWGPASGVGWGGNNWDNITQTPANSQMPSISCILDRWTGVVGPGQQDFGYNSAAVHVAYNENVGGGLVNVFYSWSVNDGAAWNGPLNVSGFTSPGPSDSDAYPNIAVDMLNGAHIAWMRGVMTPREPMRTGVNQYQPGINPANWWSFPGPDIGMYCVTQQVVYYARFMAFGVFVTFNDFGGMGQDQEFPTVALDRWQHVNVNWQETLCPFVDYEIRRITNLNLNAPINPLMAQNYAGFGVIANDSADPANDDLFPNLAHKKVSMYMSPNEAMTAGFDEVWTKVTGHGPSQAIAAGGKAIYQDGNMKWDNALPVECWMLYGD